MWLRLGQVTLERNAVIRRYISGFWREVLMRGRWCSRDTWHVTEEVWRSVIGNDWHVCMCGSWGACATNCLFIHMGRSLSDGWLCILSFQFPVFQGVERWISIHNKGKVKSLENEYVKAIKLNHLSEGDLTKEGYLILFYKIPICFDLIQKIPTVELLVVNLSLCQPRRWARKSTEIRCNAD